MSNHHHRRPDPCISREVVAWSARRPALLRRGDRAKHSWRAPVAESFVASAERGRCSRPKPAGQDVAARGPLPSDFLRQDRPRPTCLVTLRTESGSRRPSSLAFYGHVERPDGRLGSSRAIIPARKGLVKRLLTGARGPKGTRAGPPPSSRTNLAPASAPRPG